MISRRQFLKRMLTAAALLSGGGFIWHRLFFKKSSLELLGKPAPASNVTKNELGKDPILSFFLLSDLHISAGVSSMTDKLHFALKDIRNFGSPIDLLVLGGDLTDMGREADYKLLRSIMNDYQLPSVYANMGNHDYYDIWINEKGEFAKETLPNGKTDAMAMNRFMDFFGYKQPYLDFWKNDIHFILLSQEAYVGDKPEYGEGAWYSDAQMAWFKSKMKEHTDALPTFVFIHQPLPAPGTDGRTHQLVRAKEFRAILEPYRNVFVLSGHTHRNFATESHYNQENSFHWFNNASVGKTRDAANPDVAQGMYVQIYPNEVVVRGREFSDRSWIERATYKVPL